MPEVLLGDILAVLGHLVALPTESATPNRELIDWAAQHLGSVGARVTVLDGPEGRANLLASIGPPSRDGLLLSGHTDVVAAGNGWATPPYELTRIGDSLFGRGSADMKGFIACALVAVASLDDATLSRPVHLALSYDEEIGCVGVRGLLDHAGGLGLKPDLVVIGEPTLMRPRHTHLGKVAFRVAFNAPAAHSSLAPFRPSAIRCATRVLNALDAIAEPHRAAVVVDETGEPRVGVTVNVGTISGGTALNVLAERCEFTFELRHTIDFDPDELLAPLWSVVDAQRAELGLARGSEGGDPVECVEITRYPPLSTDPDDRWLRLVERLADRGRCAPLGFGTEGGLFAAAIDSPVVICGPGDISDAHRPDEYVSIEQLLRCREFLERLIAAVCVNDGSRES